MKAWRGFVINSGVASDATPIDPADHGENPTGRVDTDDYLTRTGLGAGARVFGRYRLESVAGRGGMGVVWKAYDEELERMVALKFLPELLTSDAEALDDLKRETRRALTLTHPNIVRIFDFARDDRYTAISMEYVEGRTLGAIRIEQTNRIFEAKDLGPIVRQVCAALDYAHFEGKVVHRDLKPANVMVTDGGQVRLMDFGIARSISESITRVSKVANSSGTLVYMSPQQLLGREPAIADDVYALGAMLYELLTGKPVFFSGDVALQVREVVPQSLQQRRQSLGISGHGIPANWETAIQACLFKDAAMRPSSAGAVGVQLGLTAPSVDLRIPQSDIEGDKSGLNFRVSPARIAWAFLAVAVLLGFGAFAWYRFEIVPGILIEEARAQELARQADTLQTQKRQREEQRQKRLAFFAQCREEISAIRTRVGERQMTPENVALLDRFGGDDWAKIAQTFREAVGETTDLETLLMRLRESESNLRAMIAMAHRQQLQANYHSERQRYGTALGSVRPDLLEKWGGDAWRLLQAREKPFANSDDYAAGAAFYREATTSLGGIVRDAGLRADAFARQQADEELARKKTEEDRRQQEAANLRQQELERSRLAQTARSARNATVFQGKVNIYTSDMTSCGFGFGFLAAPTLAGLRLSIFLNGKKPGLLFGGDKPDDRIDIETQKTGSARYSSGGHNFAIEWNNTDRLSPSVGVTVRLLDLSD